MKGRIRGPFLYLLPAEGMGIGFEVAAQEARNAAGDGDAIGDMLLPFDVAAPVKEFDEFAARKGNDHLDRLHAGTEHFGDSGAQPVQALFAQGRDWHGAGIEAGVDLRRVGKLIDLVERVTRGLSAALRSLRISLT